MTVSSGRCPQATAAVTLSASLGAAAGQLDFPTWTLNLGTAAFSAASVTDATAGAMANTVYHETRHAELAWRSAYGVIVETILAQPAG